ncbi:MAG: hypothetical protein IMX01_07955 [Limnochordaceae bacterium]|nr:hypothetical protein [Limnochordaceae bacterium]
MGKQGWAVAFTLVLAAGLGLASCAQAADVAVLDSERTAQWYSDLGWDYQADMAVLHGVLDKAGISYQDITVADLEAGNLGDAKLLILPHTRRMSAAEVQAVKDFLAQGGRLFALGQASFRDENNAKTRPESYQLADELGISWVTWSGNAPLHGYAKVVVADHPIFAGLPDQIRFPRNEAMVVQVYNGGKILAEWYDDDQSTPSEPDPAQNGAIIEGPAGNTIYVGDMLFIPGGADQPELQKLCINIIQYLLNK